MTTFNELIDETMLYLYGFTTLQDQATALNGAILSTDLTFTVDSAASISRGILEIDDELIWVDSVDTTANTVTVAPYGRGYRGTTAATHADNTRVVASPLFPRHVVKRALNQAIAGSYPSLFGVGKTTFIYDPDVAAYDMPAGAQKVLSVSYDTYGTNGEWYPLNRYRMDQTANLTDFTTGASITLFEPVAPGRTVQVVYTKVPTELSAGSDVFTTVTGLPSSCEDVVRLGAAYRMIPFFDSPHLSGMSAESDFAANQRPVGGAASLSRYLLQAYQIRLQEEANRLGNLFPVRVHYTR